MVIPSSKDGSEGTSPRGLEVGLTQLHYHQLCQFYHQITGSALLKQSSCLSAQIFHKPVELVMSGNSSSV